MLPNTYIAVLKLFYEKLKSTSVNWAVTGSTSFIIQGLPLKPNDIDIQTDKSGAYEFENIFKDYSVKKVQFSSTDKFKSHFGALEVNNIKIEIMGDLQKCVNGIWETPVDINKHKKFIKLEDMEMPVLDLKYEYEAYLKLGRTERAELIKKFIK